MHIHLQGSFPISAKDKENLTEVLKVLEETLPEGPQYFPEDMITDQPERFNYFRYRTRKNLIVYS